jgi:hypothetical protein
MDCFTYQPDATLGRILSHSDYGKNARGEQVAPVRRGNVGFTSCNHTAGGYHAVSYLSIEGIRKINNTVQQSPSKRKRRKQGYPGTSAFLRQAAA